MTGEQTALVVASIVTLILLGIVADEVRRIRKTLERNHRHD